MSAHRPESIDPSVRIMMQGSNVDVEDDEELPPLFYEEVCDKLGFNPSVWAEERGSDYWLSEARIALPAGAREVHEVFNEFVDKWATDYVERRADEIKSEPLPRRTPGEMLGPIDDFGTHEKPSGQGWGDGAWKHTAGGKPYFEVRNYSPEGVDTFLRSVGKNMFKLPDVDRPQPTAIIPPIQPSPPPAETVTQVIPLPQTQYELRTYEPEDTAHIHPPDLASLARQRPSLGGK